MSGQVRFLPHKVRVQTLQEQLTREERAGRYWDACCFAGCLAVLREPPKLEQRPSRFRGLGLLDLGRRRPDWLETLAAIPPTRSYFALQMALLLRVDEAACGMAWLRFYPAPWLAELEAVRLHIVRNPARWELFEDIAARRENELSLTSYKVPSLRVWRAVLEGDGDED